MEAKTRLGNIQDSVYASLRKSITNLNLAPGTVISEKEIALKFKVSRTPVRETFIHLAKEGLVQVIPQKGTVVSLIDLSRVEQESFLRESLELAVLEPFIANCGKEQFAALEELINKQKTAMDSGSYIKFVDYDDAFHRILFETAGQDLSWDVLQNIGGHYHRARLLTTKIRGIASEVVGQHKKLLSALKKKDLGGARKVLKGHLHKISGEEKLLRDEFPRYFTESEDGDGFNIDFGGLSLT
jgi:DNA-binding GntR family transcriptional regulator